MRTCRKCNEDKELSAFVRHKTSKDGYANTCKACKKSYERVWNKENADHVHLKQVVKRYGISAEHWNRLFEAQGGCCAICEKHQSTLPCRLVVDHCHDSGVVRGLLCRNCNSAIGMLEERTEVLQAAVDYLSKPRLKAVKSS